MRLLRWSYSIPNAVTWTVIGACKRIWTNGCADGIGEVCDDITLDTQHLFPVFFCLVTWSLLCFTNLISYQHKIRPTHLFDLFTATVVSCLQLKDFWLPWAIEVYHTNGQHHDWHHGGSNLGSYSWWVNFAHMICWISSKRFARFESFQVMFDFFHHKYTLKKNENKFP